MLSCIRIRIAETESTASFHCSNHPVGVHIIFDSYVKLSDITTIPHDPACAGASSRHCSGAFGAPVVFGCCLERNVPWVPGAPTQDASGCLRLMGRVQYQDDPSRDWYFSFTWSLTFSQFSRRSPFFVELSLSVSGCSRVLLAKLWMVVARRNLSKYLHWDPYHEFNHQLFYHQILGHVLY